MPQALPPAPPPAVIVVTGTALPAAKAERAYAVAYVDRRAIEQSPSHELDQLLKEVPGLQLFRRSDARSGHPTSQGVTLRALGGNASSRALLVLDGVPQSDPFGGWVNWPAYDPSELRDIRVVRGGGSVANGPGALAGTIEMTSRSDSGVSGEADYGSRQSLELRGRAGIGVGGGVLFVHAANSLEAGAHRQMMRRQRLDEGRKPAVLVPRESELVHRQPSIIDGCRAGVIQGRK